MRTPGIEIFYWIDDWATDQPPYFEKARAAGFDAVEMSLVNGPNIDVAAYKAALEAHNLQVYCSMGLPQEHDITHPDDAVRQRGSEYLKQCVETAAKLGSPVLGGLPYVPWLYFPEGNDLQPYRDRAAAVLREVAKAAAENGITITLEIINRFETFMFNTVAEATVFLEQIDHPAVKLQLDTYHLNMEEDNIAAAIRAAGDRIGHFHCAASNRKLPGKGHINWGEVRAALDDVNYSGGVIIETFPNPNSETGRTVNTWRPLVTDFDAEAAEAAAFICQQLIDG
ncbi:MAG: sugar phosphate isomerase/epimerase family protein [Chloroflexota bacterium]